MHIHAHTHTYTHTAALWRSTGGQKSLICCASRSPLLLLMGRGKPNETHSCTQPIFNLVRETERASWYGDQNESRTSRDPGIWRICFRIFFFPLSVFKGKSCWVQPSKLLIKILSFYVGNILGLVLFFCFVFLMLVYYMNALNEMNENPSLNCNWPILR